MTEIFNEFGLLSSGIINALTCCEFLFQKKENCDYKKEKSSSTADFRLILYSFLRVLMLFLFRLFAFMSVEFPAEYLIIAIIWLLQAISLLLGELLLNSLDFS